MSLEQETVVLVHGMGRSRFSMSVLAIRLERAGYSVVNYGYPRNSTIKSIALALGQRLSHLRSEKIHFVGHSLGNIVIRWLLTHKEPPNMGRVVMLAPPNNGAVAADKYAPFLSRVLPCILELKTDPSSTVRTLAPLKTVEVGIIAGTKDGKVQVSETMMDGAQHTEVPSRHSFIMNRKDVYELVLSFLANGRFTA